MGKRKHSAALRIAVYVAGVLLVSMGIVLCKKCGWGVSPVSSIPLVLSCILPLSFGAFTTLFHVVNIAIQMHLTNGWNILRLWAQVPLALAFGWVIDGISAVVQVNADDAVQCAFALAGSVLFTATGMVFMLDADLVQNPPDGAVARSTEALSAEFSRVKVLYDVACVVFSCVLGFAFLGRAEGFGVATAVLAIFVGRTVGLLCRAQEALHLLKG